MAIKNNYENYYKKSIQALELIIRKEKKTITEVNWNRIAVEKNYLSSETIGYISQIKFNKLCKNILKNIKKEMRS